MSNAPILPLDLVLEILSCLPVKALMRFRCVSKTWNSLMFDLTLIKLHLQRSQTNTYLLSIWPMIALTNDSIFYSEPFSIRTLLENPSPPLDWDNCPQFYRKKTSAAICFVIGVCNGLVGIVNYVWDNCFHEGIEYWFQFWNPATKVISSQDSPHTHFHRSGFEYNPDFCYGIGYDDRSDTYKAAIVHLDDKLQLTDVRVYTMGGTCWKNVLNCPAFCFLENIGASLNGTINWIVFRNPNIKKAYGNWETITSMNEIVFFSYDLKNETYKLLSMPGDLSEVPPWPPNHGVLNGCLCLFLHKRTHFVVWVMRELGVENSWTQLLNVSREYLQIKDSDYYYPWKPICMSKNEDVLLLVTTTYDTFVIYNRRDNRIDHTGDVNNFAQYCNCYEHVQSLVLPY